MLSPVLRHGVIGAGLGAVGGWGGWLRGRAELGAGVVMTPMVSEHIAVGAIMGAVGAVTYRLVSPLRKRSLVWHFAAWMITASAAVLAIAALALAQGQVGQSVVGTVGIAVFLVVAGGIGCGAFDYWLRRNP